MKSYATSGDVIIIIIIINFIFIFFYFKERVALRLNWSLSSQRHIGEGKKACGGQFPAYFLLPYLTCVLFILFLKYQQEPLRETEA